MIYPDRWPFGKYGAIYMDVPWHFETYSDRGQGRAPNYPTMTADELFALPVPELAADDCAMFMWVVQEQLELAMALLKYWGFKYKTRAFVWVKTTVHDKAHFGKGHWTRTNPEDCWLATKGKPKRLHADVRELLTDEPLNEVVISQKRENSRKPDSVYEWIERLVAGPYVELFGRTNRRDWTSWGLDAGQFGTV